MFGYVRPLVAELKVGEYRYYRAAYCRVCRQMGSECGAFSRAFLSYDLTFLCLLLSAVSGEKTEIRRGRCSVNPLARRDLLEGSAYTDYAAAACGLLAACRFSDDKQDEKGLRRLAAWAGEGLSAGWVRRVRAAYPGLCEGIEERLAALNAAEAEAASRDTVSLDILAEKFGDVLAFLCAFPFAGSSEREDAQRSVICTSVGRHVGRWIYCVDAIDDLPGDEKKGRFNPFLSAYGKPEFTEEEKMTLKCLLGAEAGEASDALLLCENFADASHEPLRIVENILGLGMPDVADAVLNGTYRKPGKDRL